MLSVAWPLFNMLQETANEGTAAPSPFHLLSLGACLCDLCVLRETNLAFFFFFCLPRSFGESETLISSPSGIPLQSLRRNLVRPDKLIVASYLQVALL